MHPLKNIYRVSILESEKSCWHEKGKKKSIFLSCYAKIEFASPPWTTKSFQKWCKSISFRSALVDVFNSLKIWWCSQSDNQKERHPDYTTWRHVGGKKATNLCFCVCIFWKWSNYRFFTTTAVISGYNNRHTKSECEGKRKCSKWTKTRETFFSFFIANRAKEGKKSN